MELAGINSHLFCESQIDYPFEGLCPLEGFFFLLMSFFNLPRKRGRIVRLPVRQMVVRNQNLVKTFLTLPCTSWLLKLLQSRKEGFYINKTKNNKPTNNDPNPSFR